VAGKKAAETRKHRAAGKKAAETRKRRAAGRKAAVTMRSKRVVPGPVAPATSVPPSDTAVLPGDAGEVVTSK